MLVYDELETEMGGTFADVLEGSFFYQFPNPKGQGQPGAIVHVKLEGGSTGSGPESLPAFVDLNDTDGSGRYVTYKTAEWLTNQTQIVFGTDITDNDEFDIYLPAWKKGTQSQTTPGAGTFTCATSTGYIEDSYSYYMPEPGGVYVAERQIESSVPYKAVYSTNVLVYLSSWYEAQNGFPACAQQCAEVKTSVNSWDVYTWVDRQSGTDERDGAIDEQNTGNVSFAAQDETKTASLTPTMERLVDTDYAIHKLFLHNISTVLANPFDAACPVPDGVTDRGLVYSEVDFSSTTVYTVTIDFEYDY
jgi:hypothetical protein